jgi:hypothetical protein
MQASLFPWVHYSINSHSYLDRTGLDPVGQKGAHHRGRVLELYDPSRIEASEHLDSAEKGPKSHRPQVLFELLFGTPPLQPQEDIWPAEVFEDPALGARPIGELFLAKVFQGLEELHPMALVGPHRELEADHGLNFFSIFVLGPFHKSCQASADPVKTEKVVWR